MLSQVVHDLVAKVIIEFDSVFLIIERVQLWVH